MLKPGNASLVDHFVELEDTRIGCNRRHTLIDIVALTVCAVISGCVTWEDIQDDGDFKLEWLQRCFFNWVEAVREQTDGKPLRRSVDDANSKLPVHVVSACAEANGMVLGQMKTSDHSNEITAIPALLDLLKVQGCIVTIDAEGCQTEIARKIREKKADYVPAVKGNQPNLLEQTKDLLDVPTDADIGEQWLEKHETLDHR